MRIAAFTGSLVDSRVGAHAIINAANPDVGLGSGVSGALREACGGAAFQREVRERLEEEYGEPLQPGDCLVTGPGASIAFRWVLHVPSVDYRRTDAETGGSTGPSRVRACFRSALEESVALAREHGLSGQFVLATPLLGAGHGGLGSIVALDVLMGTLRDYLHECPTEEREVLARVVFAVLTPEEARLVALAAGKQGLSFAP
ncbi:macro domain-containing protein [Archangium lansingense]|uniref:Macro domain-containing protein n=1 Tax=Archangium lansingense TaxID=2995310 RepID=A0ABT4ANI9_9BACT|nr:macro domain-containing protein [Archangium lansinium]MCY1083267.1 macro domain-containing protein [Archangium lansinium]